MIGERIHSYEINAHLGQGGMGNVYRATDTMLGREVALKMLHPQLTMQPQFLERFKKEARVLAQLLHPNIAVIYNFIEQGGNHFMVMEYVEGTSLDDYLKKYGALPAEFVVPVFVQALEGLYHAHKKNIFHRDIKPSNLMITSEGTLKLMDFGIAKVAGEQKMTQVNKIVGTIEFMAPELIEGKDASIASDIYSMGATLYELVSGRLPFESDTDFNLMQSILKKKITAPDRMNPSIPKRLSDIILKAMDRNPDHRYHNAREFQQALLAAFPGSRDIDTGILNKANYASGLAGAGATRVADDMATKTMMHPKLVNDVQSRLKDFFSDRKTLMIIAGLLLLLLLGFVVLNSIGGGEEKEGLVLKTDSTEKKSFNKESSTGTIVTEPRNNEQVITPPQQVQETPAQPGPEQTPEKTKEETPKRKPKEEQPKPTTPQEQVVPATPAVPEKKEIYINSKVEVNLSLVTMPDMNQKEKSAQRVKFSVSRPVYYNGALIIRQGAIATGNLTIGRVMTDIEINQVEGANGKNISLRSKAAHGSRKDIESGKQFTAIIQEGTRGSF